MGITNTVDMKCEKPKPRTQNIYSKKEIENVVVKSKNSIELATEEKYKPLLHPQILSAENTSIPVTQSLPINPDRVTEVKVYLYEYEIDLSSKNIPAGTIIFKVQNTGNFSHDFAIIGLGNYGKIRPGEQRSFSAVIGPGTYEIHSPRRKDVMANMSENFFVTE